MNENEKNASIAYILSQGLVKRQTTIERITDMLRTVGFRYLFWDTGYSLFFTAVTITGVLVLYILAPSQYRYTAAVAVAPLLFLLITLFAETSERVSKLYELKQTCRYTIRQITALRVICYSVVGFVFTVVVTAISAHSGHEFLSLFPLCLAALFICAILGLSAARYMHGKWVHAVFSAVWVFVNILLPFSLGGKWEALLREMPVVFSAALVVLGVAVLAYQISNMLSEGKNDAVA